MYYLIDWKVGKDGSREPRLPEDIGFLMLAEPADDAPFALFDCHLDLECDEPLPDGVEEVDERLDLLLESGERYPPAMAITRDKVRKICRRGYTKDSFCSAICECLENELGNQRKNKYIMAKASKEEIGYLSKGAYYWVIDYRRDIKEALWVSSDYHVYRNRIGDFEVSESELISLFCR